MKTLVSEFVKSLLGLFKNPYAVMFAVAHWLLIGFLFVSGQTTTNFDNWETLLFAVIMLFDLPAILIAAILWIPAFLLQKDEMFLYGTFMTFTLTATLQWLIIGNIFFNILAPFESQMTTLSLKDE